VADDHRLLLAQRLHQPHDVTVAEDDERALTLLGEVHGDAVGPDGSISPAV
jgi:hypothetical protein